MATGLISGAIKTLVLMVALLLVPMVQQVRAQGEGAGPGAGPGGASPQRRTILIFPSSKWKEIYDILNVISVNDDIQYKLKAPNIGSTAGAEIVNMTRAYNAQITAPIVEELVNGKLREARLRLALLILNLQGSNPPPKFDIRDPFKFVREAEAYARDQRTLFHARRLFDVLEQ